MLLNDNKPELDRKIAQLEIIGDLRNVQKLIVEEETNMALTYNIERDIRYNQGLESGASPDLQTTLDKIEANGGHVIVSKTEIPGEMSFYAIFNDTEGNRVGLHSA